MEEQRLTHLKTMPYEDYLKTPEWTEKRTTALEWAHHRCQVCYTSDDLDVHHRTYERRGNEQMSDLIVLCHSCHSLFHSAKRLEHGQQPFALTTETLGDLINVFERQQGTLLGVATGYSDLDRLLGGLNGGDLIVFAGRHTTGKSTLSLNIAYNAAKRDHNVLYVSLQHDRLHLLHRLVALGGQVDMQRLRTGRIEDMEWTGMAEAFTTFETLPLWFYDHIELSPSDLEACLTQLRSEEEQQTFIDLVVIDELHLLGLTSSQRENRTHQMYNMLRAMKFLARKHNIPILLTCPVSHQVDARQNKVPQIADLLPPGIIEQFADIICILYRDEMYHPNEAYHLETERKQIVDITIVKNAHGPVGEVSVHYAPETFLFEDLEAKVDDPDA